MNCYLDSSVILRKLFGEPNPLKEWTGIRKSFSSRLLSIECRRSIDRLRLVRNISNEALAEHLASLENLLAHVGVLTLTEEVYSRAEQPFSTPLGTLDGIHLATALHYKSTKESDFFFATHDQHLALAAKAHGLTVIGM